MGARHPADRRGFTLVEAMISLTIMMAVTAVGVRFYLTQHRNITTNAGRADAQLNAAFALDQIDRDLRVAGSGNVTGQPLLVAGTDLSVTFNVNLTTRSSGDVTAVYYDPDADPATVNGLDPSSPVTLPGIGYSYPAAQYWLTAGVPSAAETISYWVEADSAAAGRYRLMRQVNAAPPRVMARNLLLPTGQPVFRYFVTDSSKALIELPAARLPLYHSETVHGSPGDTNQVALTDSVRLVRLQFTSVHRDARQGDITRTEQRSVRLLNAGLLNATTCGDVPQSGGIITVVTSGTPSVSLTWAPSPDEAGGSQDVERYAIYRKVAGAATFGEPIANTVAGLASYTYVDTDVVSGELWEYGIAAQDCTPGMSTIVTTAVVTVP